jgi:hypothetical protein
MRADMGFDIAIAHTSPTINGPNWHMDDRRLLWRAMAETDNPVGLHAIATPTRPITKGALKELFPHVPPAPEDGTELSEDA